jgi:putative chitinase
VSRTKEDWTRILTACGIKPVQVEQWSGVFAHTPKMERFSKGDADLAQFLANILVESQGLQKLRENGNYSAARIREMGMASPAGSRWRSLVPRADALAFNEPAFFEACYGGRGGNRPEGSGDGARYPGRGLIMLTFADGYRWQGMRSGQDLIELPELAEQPHFALEFAFDWWEGKVSDAFLADTTRVRKVVNGGTFGLKEVEEMLVKVRRALA